MKRIVSLIAVAVVVCCTVFTACEPKKKADQKAEISSIVLTKAANPSLSADITGKVDVAKKTITFAIPVSLSNRNLIPSFVLSDEDVLSQDGVKLVSGSSTMLVENGKQLVLSDELSALSYTFTIVVLDNDESAVLLSAEFLAADNSKLDENVSVAEISSNMLVRVPAEAFMQKLTLSLSAGEGDVITVNGEALTGGKLEVDTSFPIDIVVSDEIAETSSTYVLKVGKILSYVASHVGTYSKTGSTMGYYHDLAINPKDGTPYIIYDAQDEGVSKKQANVVKWNNNAFETVGNESFSGLNSTVTDLGITFNPDGIAYVSYRGGDVSNKHSVSKLESGKWSKLGDENTAACLYNSNAPMQNEATKLFFTSTGKPVLIYRGNTKSVASYRNANIASYDGTWTESTLSGVLNYDTDGVAFYGHNSAKIGNDNYALMNWNTKGFYVYKVNDNLSVSAIVENYIPEGAPYALPTGAKICSDGKKLYVSALNETAQKYEFYIVDPTDKSIKHSGNSIAIEGKITISFSVSTDDSTMLVVIETPIDSKNSIVSYAMTDENGALGEFTTLSTSYLRNDIRVEYAGNNTFYTTLMCKDSEDNIFVELHKIALEADIIPE